MPSLSQASRTRRMATSKSPRTCSAVAPYAALVDRLVTGPPRIEDVAAGADGVALDAEEIAALARVADLVDGENFPAGDALESHTARTPRRAIGETIAVEAMSPKAA